MKDLGIESAGQSEEIAIVGIGCKFPDANNYISFWNNLKEGKNSIQDIISRKMVIDNEEFEVGRWAEKFYSPNIDKPNTSNSRWCGLIDRIDEFDNQFFNITPREAKNMDPQQRLLLQETWHCIEDSAVPLYDLRKKKTGVLIGVMASDYHQEISNEKIIIDSYAGLGNYDCILANRISYHFGFSGISMAADAACASSLVAIHQGRNSLLNYESDYILAGGVALNSHPWKYISFSKSRMLSPDGQCKTFDRSANGYVPGEGVAVILMQRLSDAIEAGNHIYGIVKSSHVNHCGFSRSITAPSIEAQEELIKKTFETARIRPNSISYIETHGTGTSLGDPIEIEALSKAFRNFIPTLIDKEEFEKEIITWIESGKTRDFVKECYEELPNQSRQLKAIPESQRKELETIFHDIKYISNSKQFCKVGSLKTNIGHLEACAGIAGVIKVLMMMKYREIPPTLNLVSPNPIVNWEITPFTIAGYTKRVSKFAHAISTQWSIKDISPTLFNQRSIKELATALQQKYAENISPDETKESIEDTLHELAIEHLNIDREELTKETILYKQSQQWYPPEINLLVQLLKFKYRMNVVNDEIIHSLSIDDVADLLVSIQKETLEEYFADGKVMPEYELVKLMISDLVEAVAQIYNIPPEEVDISKNIGTFQKTPLRSAVSSFGFGGVNSHLILEEFPQIYQDNKKEAPFNLFLLSAKTEKSFYEMRESWKRYTKSTAFQKFTIRDICSNLMVGREHFPYRSAVIFNTKEAFDKTLDSLEPHKVHAPKLKALRVGSILWTGFSYFTDLEREIPIFKEQLLQIERVLKELDIYKTVRDGITQNTWSPKYHILYSFIVNMSLLQTVERLGCHFDLLIPEKDGALLALTLSKMISIEEALLILLSQKEIGDITLSTPTKPIVDIVKQETISPFYFTVEYLQNLRNKVMQPDRDLNHLYLDAILDGNNADHSIRLATIFKKNNIITEEEMQEYLQIHENTGFGIDDIVREKKRKVSLEEIAECVQENDLLRFYVDDIMSVDTARQLNENQYTFKGFVDEWNRILIEKKSLNIHQILDKESKGSADTQAPHNEKELLLIIIATSLKRLSARWNLSNSPSREDDEFNELISLIVDGVLSKESAITLMLDSDPDYNAIVYELNGNQFKCNKENGYEIITRESQKHIKNAHGSTIETWFNELNESTYHFLELQQKNIPIIDKELSSFNLFEFGPIPHPSKEPLFKLLTPNLIIDELRDSLLRMWLAGYELKWHKIIKEGDYNRLALPLYRFNKKSFWLHDEEYNDDMEQSHKNSGIMHRFMRSTPHTKEISTQPHVPESSHSLHFFKPNNEKCELVTDPLSLQPVILFRTNPSLANGVHSFYCNSVKELTEAIENNSSKALIPVILGTTHHTMSLQMELKEQFYALKALTSSSKRSQLRVLSYVEETSDSFETLTPALQGAMKSLALEYSEIRWKSVTTNNPIPIDILLNEIREKSWQTTVSYQNSQRLIRGADTHITLSNKQISIATNGIYIVAGGSGSLGREVCSILAKENPRAIVILGRSPKSKSFEEFSQALSKDTKVLYLQWSAASYKATDKLCNTIREKLGPIKGVINCAGVVNDGFFQHKKWDDYKQVLSTKMVTTINLHKATQTDTLDFFVLFSSIVSDTGNLGQVDYCGANTFINKFVQYRISKGFSGNSLALKFTLFSNTGMGTNKRAEENFGTTYNKTYPGIIHASDLQECFLHLLQQSGEVAVTSNEEYQWNCRFQKEDELLLDEVSNKEILLSILSKKISIPAKDIPQDEPFFSLGVGSLGIHEITAALGKKYPNLSPTVLFEYPNVTELTSYLDTLSPQTDRFDIVNASLKQKISPPETDAELLTLLQEFQQGAYSLDDVINLTEGLHE